MSKAIGANGFFRSEFVVEENSFPQITLKINKQRVEGREVHGFFLTNEEFPQISPSVCSDGWFENLIIQLDKGEPMIMAGAQEPIDDEKYWEEIDGGRFVVGGYLWMKDKLAELKLPTREIKIRNKFGWSFKE